MSSKCLKIILKPSKGLKYKVYLSFSGISKESFSFRTKKVPFSLLECVENCRGISAQKIKYNPRTILGNF
jgi:hypothetical protein